jgi:hypothetical protein
MPDTTGMGAEMSECCGSGSCSETAAGVSVCPVSGHKGAAVELQTVKALLTETALTRIGRTAHRFCPEPSCDVVYFDAEGVCYTQCDVRVPVWHKEPFGNCRFSEGWDPSFSKPFPPELFPRLNAPASCPNNRSRV